MLRSPPRTVTRLQAIRVSPQVEHGVTKPALVLAVQRAPSGQLTAVDAEQCHALHRLHAALRGDLPTNPGRVMTQRGEDAPGQSWIAVPYVAGERRQGMAEAV